MEESSAVLPLWLCLDRQAAFRWMAGHGGACFYIENFWYWRLTTTASIVQGTQLFEEFGEKISPKNRWFPAPPKEKRDRYTTILRILKCPYCRFFHFCSEWWLPWLPCTTWGLRSSTQTAMTMIEKETFNGGFSGYTIHHDTGWKAFHNKSWRCWFWKCWRKLKKKV